MCFQKYFIFFSLSFLFFLSGCGGDWIMKVLTTSLPDGQVGVEYSAQMKGECGGDIWLIKSGNLPPGISFAEDGKLAGIPTLAGTYTFTVELVDYYVDYGFENEDESERRDKRAFKGFSIKIEEAEEEVGEELEEQP